MSGSDLGFGDLTMKELRQRWQKAFGNVPPVRASRDLLELGIGWHIQSKKFGGLDRAERERITELVADFRGGRAPGATPRHPGLNPGVTLVREWSGRTFQVQVLEKGFLCDHKVWGSLSEIAREITGARWNGPKFFGLRQAQKQAA
ncbi:MAG: hypothetical protein CVT81_01880 [Alphaproteobacteria bacterium HGW-Alphaproteobacteria-3]|nr:MAG: hypothetical protein CVT81_01880 [Alphaproteobacteria bacterium HGW-Alphaproteobacteria-3]